MTASQAPRSTIRPAYITAMASASPRHHRQIVGDPQQSPSRRPRRCACTSDRICAWIVTSKAVVGSSAMMTSGVVQQRGRNGDALAHAAGEFVRVGVKAFLRMRNAHAAQRVARHGPCLRRAHAPMRAHRLRHLRAHAQHVIQARHRVLHDEGDPVAAQGPHGRFGQADQILPIQPNPAARDPARRGHQVQDGISGQGLAGPAFPHQAQRLPTPQGERHGVDRRPVARRRWETGRSGPRPQARSRPVAARVQHFAQPVADQVDGEHQHQQGHAGEDADPNTRRSTGIGTRWRSAGPAKAASPAGRRPGTTSVASSPMAFATLDGRHHRQRRQGIGQHVPEQDPACGDAEALRRRDVVALPLHQRAAARDPGEITPTAPAPGRG